MKQYIEAEWLKYRIATVPIDAGPAQVFDTQCAFFTGAAALFSLITNAVSEGEEVSQADLQLMDDLNAEIHAFVETISDVVKQKGE